MFILIDGKYFIIIGNTTRSVNSQKFQLGPLTHSKSSNEKTHCLQFWYSARGQGVGKITIVYNKTNGNQNDDTFIFNGKEQGRFIIDHSLFSSEF